MRYRFNRSVFLAFLAVLFISFPLFSQDTLADNGSITGHIRDSLSGKSVPFAVVAVFKNGNTNPAAQTLSSDSGDFRFTKLAYGIYKIKISSLGYKPYAMGSIVINEVKFPVDLGNISLATDAKMLNGATITAAQDVIDNQPDKLVYHADNDVTAAGGTAVDLLKKVPGVSVDINGNLELLGASGVRILINGKPSPILASNPADVLQAIPADQIKSIEVITSPSAKYDAQGTGGIINIIMKKALLPGVNGSLNVSGGTRIDKLNGMIGYRHDDFSISANVGGNYFVPQNGTNYFLRTTTLNDTMRTLSQDGNWRSGRNNFYPTLNLDWDISDNDNISLSAGWEDFRNAGNTTTNIFSSTQGANDDQLLLKHAYNATRESSLEISADYSHDFDTTGKQMEFSFEYSGDRDSTDFSFDQSLVSAAQPSNPGDFLLKQQGGNLGKENESIFSLDFTLPFKNDFTVETGAEATLYTVNSNYVFRNFDTLNNDYATDPSQSNTFISKQQVGALYSTCSFKPGGKFTVKAGVRYEQTYSNNYLVNSASSYRQTYGTLIPSLAVYRKFKLQTIKLNYTRRIERPEYDDMNPFLNTSDRNNLVTGNPYLIPEQQHRIEFSYSLSGKSGGAFTATLFYRHNANDIQNYTVIYPVFISGSDTFQNVAVTTRENIVTKNSIGLNIFGSVTLWKKLSVRGNFNTSQDYLSNTRDPSAAVVKTFRYNVHVNFTMELPRDILAEAFGVFNSPRYTLQGYRPSYSEYSFGIRKQFNKKKGSIGLNATDPFSKNITFTTRTTGTDFTQKNISTVPYRSFGITFTYLFGKLKERDEQNDNQGNSLFQK